MNTTTTSSTSTSTSSSTASASRKRSRSRSPPMNQEGAQEGVFNFDDDEDENEEEGVLLPNAALKMLSDLLQQVHIRPAVEPQPTELDKWHLQQLKAQIKAKVAKRKKLIADIKNRKEKLSVLKVKRTSNTVPPGFKFKFEPRVPESHKDIADKMNLAVAKTELTLLDLSIESKTRTIEQSELELTTTNLALLDADVVFDFSEPFRASAQAQYHILLDTAYKIDDARFKMKQDIATTSAAKAQAAALVQDEAVQHAVAEGKETIGHIVDRKLEAFAHALRAELQINPNDSIAHARPVTVTVVNNDKDDNSKNTNKRKNKKDTKNDLTPGGGTNNQVKGKKPKKSQKQKKQSQKKQSQKKQQSGKKQEENKQRNTKQRPNTAKGNNRNDSGNQKQSTKKRGQK